VIVREALLEELPFIRVQRVRSYQEHAERIPEEHWKALKRAISSEADMHPGVDRLVAEIDGAIVGSVVLFPAKTDAYEGFAEQLEYPEIRMLAVTPETRGKGVAKALITECIKIAKARGFQSIGLHTGDFMVNAMNLYEHLGFKRLPEFDFIPADDGIVVKAYRLVFK